jgi:hypothetical protein
MRDWEADDYALQFGDRQLSAGMLARPFLRPFDVRQAEPRPECVHPAAVGLRDATQAIVQVAQGCDFVLSGAAHGLRELAASRRPLVDGGYLPRMAVRGVVRQSDAPN